MRHLAVIARPWLKELIAEVLPENPHAEGLQ